MEKIKVYNSPDYNFIFNPNNGFFARWGKTKEDDPAFSPHGNEILDIEITDICKGPGGVPCPFCYKSNNPKNTNNMTLDMFKDVMAKMPKTLTQIAIGADAQATANPDIWKMMEHSRSLGIVPNITVADISDDTADKLSSLCGAVAVSRYVNKNYCYDSIKKLVDRGMKQINIHIMISEETYDQIFETFYDYIDGEERLNGLNAIVLLSLKTKGRGESFTPLSQKKFSKLVNFAMENNIPIGFDSCSCHKFLESIKERGDYKHLEMMSEPCESTCFSAYVNCKGDFFPCSFAEGEGEWKTGIHVPDCEDYKGFWNQSKTENFRKILLGNGRHCPLFEV